MKLEELLTLASKQQDEVRRARETMQGTIDRRNITVRLLREAGASYSEIAKALRLTRAGAIGICRKITSDL